MRYIIDVRCGSCNKVSEEFGAMDATYKCSCGGTSERIISPVKCKLEGYSGDFPGAAMRWEREHTNAGKKNG